MQILNKIYDFITKPTKAFEAEEKSSAVEAIKYFLILTVLAVILSALSSLAFGNLSIKLLNALGAGKLAAASEPVTLSSTLVLLPLSYLLSIVGTGISVLWFHLFALIFGAKQGIKETVKIIAYGATPTYFFSWIPFLGIFVAIWSYILYGIGFIKLQKMSTGRAVLAVLLAVLIPMIIALLIIIAIIAIIIATGISLPLAQ